MPSPTIMRKAKNTTYTLGHFVLQKSFSPEIVFCPTSLEHKFGIPIVYSISIFSIFGIPKTIKGTLVFVSKIPSIAANFAGWYFAVLHPCMCPRSICKKVAKKANKIIWRRMPFPSFFLFPFSKKWEYMPAAKKEKESKDATAKWKNLAMQDGEKTSCIQFVGRIFPVTGSSKNPVGVCKKLFAETDRKNTTNIPKKAKTIPQKNILLSIFSLFANSKKDPNKIKGNPIAFSQKRILITVCCKIDANSGKKDLREKLTRIPVAKHRKTNAKNIFKKNITVFLFSGDLFSFAVQNTKKTADPKSKDTNAVCDKIAKKKEFSFFFQLFGFPEGHLSLFFFSLF